MSIIFLSSGIFSTASKIAKKLSDEHGFKVYSDDDIIEKAADKYKMKIEVFKKTIEGKPIAFNNFTHEKEKCIACMKAVLSELLTEKNVIFFGLSGHLIPATVSLILKVLVISDIKTRAQNGINNYALSEKEALKKVHDADEIAFLWTNSLHNTEPWDNSLYDIIIPTDKLDTKESIKLILDNLSKVDAQTDLKSKLEVSNFELATRVERILIENGHCVLVEADQGDIVLTINKHVIMLSMYEQKIKKIAAAVPGVKSVKTKIGKEFYKADTYRQHDFKLSPRVLLVDDEREFVQTLSERLQMRDVGTHVVYDGQNAIDFAEQEDLEVMVVDLKMPGVDGFEVLKRIKETKPGIEVIILTGHGSEKDRKTCMELGAFAYLQKPADIDLLTRTMQEAYDKINLKKETL